MQKCACKKVSNSKSKKSPGGGEEGNEVLLGLPCGWQKTPIFHGKCGNYGQNQGVANSSLKENNRQQKPVTSTTFNFFMVDCVE